MRMYQLYRYRIKHINLKLWIQIFICMLIGLGLCLLSQPRSLTSQSVCVYPTDTQVVHMDSEARGDNQDLGDQDVVGEQYAAESEQQEYLEGSENEDESYPQEDDGEQAAEMETGGDDGSEGETGDDVAPATPKPAPAPVAKPPPPPPPRAPPKPPPAPPKAAPVEKVDLDGETPFSLALTNQIINDFGGTLPQPLDDYRNRCWMENVPEDFDYFDNYYYKCLKDRKQEPQRLPTPAITTVITDLNQTILARQRRGESWRIRCYPHVLVIGTAKSATGAIFEALRNYVHGFVPSTIRKVHFWDFKLDDLYINPECGDRVPTFADYMDMFDKPAETIRETSFMREGVRFHSLFTGEATPTTFTNLFDWQSFPGNEELTEPRFVTAHFLYNLYPENRFIVMMRDPVDRLYSEFREKTRAEEDETPRYTEDMFPDLVKKSLEQYRQCEEEKGTTRACVYSDTDYDVYHMLVKGIYQVFVADWMAVYRPNQFLFLKTEELKIDRVNIIKLMPKFLRTRPLTPVEEKRINAEQQEFLDELERSPTPEMDPEIKTLLQEFYRQHNEKLSVILSDPKWKWGY